MLTTSDLKNLVFLTSLPILIFGVFVSIFELLFRRNMITGMYIIDLGIFPFVLYSVGAISGLNNRIIDGYNHNLKTKEGGKKGVLEKKIHKREKKIPFLIRILLMTSLLLVTSLFLKTINFV